MTSLDEYKRMFNENYEDLIPFFEKYGYKYIKNSYSSFDVSPTTVASIINLNPIAKVGQHIFESGLTFSLYPNLLSKQNFDIKLYPKLLQILKKINYDFIWVGNTLADCSIYNFKLCINYEGSKTEKETISKYIDTYVLYSFVQSTPFDEIYRILSSFDDDFSRRSNNYFIDNDAINKFIKHNKINSLSFYLIHHLAPHSPYIYDENCKYKNDDIFGNISDQKKGYKLNYICTIKKIKKLIKYLSIKDPNAVVIIQGDHGFKNNVPTKEPVDKTKFKIFNLIKVPDNCKKYLSNKIDNINASRLALSCATDSKITLLDPQIYYTIKENKKYGEVKVLK